MDLEQYISELKAHDWNYQRAEGQAYYKGRDNHRRLLKIANQNGGEFAEAFARISKEKLG